MEDFRDLRRLNVCYKSGVDLEGRTIVTLVYPETFVDHRRLFLFFLLTLDAVAEAPYCLIYCHRADSQRGSRSGFVQPSFRHLMRCYSALPRKFKKNLAVYLAPDPGSMS